MLNNDIKQVLKGCKRIKADIMGKNDIKIGEKDFSSLEELEDYVKNKDNKVSDVKVYGNCGVVIYR